MIDGEAPAVDFSGGNRRLQGTVRLAVVVAIAEATLPEVGAKLAEGEFDFLAVEVAEAEFLQFR